MCIVQSNRSICDPAIPSGKVSLVLGKRVQQEGETTSTDLPSKKSCIKSISTPVVNTVTVEESPIEITTDRESQTPLELSAVQIERLEAINHSNLIRAARIGDSNKINEILELYPQLLDRTHIGYSALHYAVFYNHREAVNTLIEAGATIDIRTESGITPLAWGVDRGHSDLVGFLLECEADPSIKNSDGISPIHTAVRSKNYTMVETLLSINTESEEWTDVNARTNLGCTPSYFAAFDGSLEILQLLYEYGAKFDISSNANVSPLHRATSKEHIAVVKYLLECGANVNKQDNNGRTCLHAAAFLGNEELVQVFIDARAKVLLDESGRTPMDLANIRKFTAISELLLEYNSSTCEW